MLDAPAIHHRVPPHNYGIEQALLGAILVQNSVYERVADIVQAEHFAHPAHALIFRTCGELISADRQATPITLHPIIGDDPTLEELGGMKEYLVTLVNSVVTIINAKDYARQIADLAARRRLIDIGTELAERAHVMDIDTSAAAIQEETEGKLFELQASPSQSGGWMKWTDSIAAALEAAETAHKAKMDGSVTGIPTGLADLDRKLGGLHDTDLIILAGRPGMGKTSLAVTMAIGAAKAGYKIGIFSLEMGDGQLALRVLCGHAGLSVEAVRNGDTTQEDIGRLTEAAQELSGLGIHIDPASGLSITAMRTRARRLARRHGLDLVIVDYIGLAEASDADKRREKVHQIEAITKGLKALAKDLNIPVLALSQLSRQVENRDDKRPMLADLRDSGSIEQDADVVMFVYREEYYISKQEPKQGVDEDEGRFSTRYMNWQARMAEAANVGEVLVRKNRHGSEATIRLFFDGAGTRFTDLVRGDAA